MFQVLHTAAEIDAVAKDHHKNDMDSQTHDAVKQALQGRNQGSRARHGFVLSSDLNPVFEVAILNEWADNASAAKAHKT